MRLVYIAGGGVPSRTASSIQVIRMCQAFADLGHEVLLIAPNTPDRERRVADLFQFYGVPPRFRVQHLPWLRVKGWGYCYGLAAALIVRRFRPDLVYGRYLPGCFFSSFFGFPIVFEAHTPVRVSGWESVQVFSRLARSPGLRRLVVISEALKRDFLEHCAVAPEKILVAHDGAAPQEPGPRMAAPSGGRLQVGYVGHLYPGKGMELIAELAPRCPWADFHIIGGTEQDVTLWRERCEGRENLVFHGFALPSKTSALLAALDVVLAPYQEKALVYGSRRDVSAWMSPLKIFEYMAAGKAIVCSDLPVLREILCHGETALLCDVREPGPWAEALHRLRQDRDLRERLGTRAREQFLNHFTWEKRALRVIEGLP